MTVTMLEGLSSHEVAAVLAHFGPDHCEEAATEVGTPYVSVTFSEEKGIHRAICRHRGKVALLDEEGRVLAKGRTVEEVLAAA